MNDFMNKFRRWYITNYLEITWFLIGWMTMAFFEDISKGRWLNALIDAILIYINYAMARR